MGRWADAATRARTRVRHGRTGTLAWKVVVGVAGAVAVVAGVAMLVLPGPGWATIVVGLAIWSTEFGWAARVRRRVVDGARAGSAWLARRSRPVRAAVVAGIALVVVLAAAAACWVGLAVGGVPQWVPGPVAEALAGLPAVGGE